MDRWGYGRSSTSAVHGHLAPVATSGLARRYADRHPDLADLCLILVSELYPNHPVITVDGDFRVYRRNRRGTIPVIMPPE